jgi:hypothetical protein
MSMSPRLLRPRASGFNPKNVLGLAAWFDASDASSVTLNGSTVSLWGDKSGNGRNAIQDTALNQPTWLTNQQNGLPAITWDGSRFMATAAFPLLAYQYGFVVVSMLSNSNAAFQRGAVNDVHSLLTQTPTVRSRLSTGGLESTASYAGSVMSVFFWKTFTPTSGTATTTLRVNGVESSTSSGSISTTLTDRILTVGALSSSIFRMTGTMCELAYYQSTAFPSSLQITALEKYAGRKWGVSVA